MPHRRRYMTCDHVDGLDSRPGLGSSHLDSIRDRCSHDTFGEVVLVVLVMMAEATAMVAMAAAEVVGMP